MDRYTYLHNYMYICVYIEPRVNKQTCMEASFSKITDDLS